MGEARGEAGFMGKTRVLFLRDVHMQKLSRCLVGTSGAQGEQREGNTDRPRKNRSQQWNLRRNA